MSDITNEGIDSIKGFTLDESVASQITKQCPVFPFSFAAYALTRQLQNAKQNNSRLRVFCILFYF